VESVSQWIGRLPQQVQEVVRPAWEWANGQPVVATVVAFAIVILVLFLLSRILKIVLLGALVVAVVGGIAVFVVGSDRARAYLQRVYAAEPPQNAEPQESHPGHPR
jgi:hypothetical protein